MDNNTQNGYTYTYSSREQAELKKIREKYTPPTETEDKLTRLRRLDASVTNTAQAISLIFGVIGALMLGFGMSLVMSDLAAKLELGSGAAMAIGIAVGVIGAGLAALAYPIYNLIVKAKRKQLAPEIIRLTDELIK